MALKLIKMAIKLFKMALKFVYFILFIFIYDTDTHKNKTLNRQWKLDNVAFSQLQFK